MENVTGGIIAKIGCINPAHDLILYSSGFRRGIAFRIGQDVDANRFSCNRFDENYSIFCLRRCVLIAST